MIFTLRSRRNIRGNFEDTPNCSDPPPPLFGTLEYDDNDAGHSIGYFSLGISFLSKVNDYIVFPVEKWQEFY